MSFKNRKVTVTIFRGGRGNGKADQPGAVKGGLAAVLFLGSTDLGPPLPRKQLGAHVGCSVGRQGEVRVWGGGQRKGRGEALLTFLHQHRRPPTGPSFGSAPHC